MDENIKTTLNELKNESSKVEYRTMSEEILINFVIKKAQKIYGEKLDSIIIDRIKYEANELSKCCDVNDILKVTHFIKNEPLHLSRLSYSNSFIFYLLGIGSVNPLPRHRYCTFCHEFHEGEGDKSNSFCPHCGKPYLKDGYNLAFEILLDEIKRYGLKFRFSSNKSYKNEKLHIQYFESDLIKLAIELGFTQKEIESNDVSLEDTKLIMKYLTGSNDLSEYSDYNKDYKRINICNHLPFIGIPELGSKLFFEVFNEDFECFESFDDFAKIYAMLHGTRVIYANVHHVCEFLVNSLIEEAIATRDDLYNLLINYNKLNKEDVINICRETCFAGRGNLTEENELKLKKAGVDEKYIEFLKTIKYIFHKGHSVGHTRLIIKIAKIYLNDPLRYYKAYFSINKAKLSQVYEDYRKNKILITDKVNGINEIYLAIIDLIERGYNPKILIDEVLKEY